MKRPAGVSRLWKKDEQVFGPALHLSTAPSVRSYFETTGFALLTIFGEPHLLLHDGSDLSPPKLLHIDSEEERLLLSSGEWWNEVSCGDEIVISGRCNAIARSEIHLRFKREGDGLLVGEGQKKAVAANDLLAAGTSYFQPLIQAEEATLYMYSGSPHPTKSLLLLTHLEGFPSVALQYAYPFNETNRPTLKVPEMEVRNIATDAATLYLGILRRPSLRSAISVNYAWRKNDAGFYTANLE